MSRSNRPASTLPPPPSDPITPGRQSPRREVPPHIVRPDYAEDGEPGDRDTRAARSAEELEAMRTAGRVAADVLVAVGEAVAPGVTTDELDELAHQLTIDAGGYPSPLNYRGFPKSLCTSVNEVVCHGIPDSRALRDGDIVNLDVTVYIDGVHGDTSSTFGVGDVDERSLDLMATTRRALDAAIATVHPGSVVSDIGAAIEATVDGTDLGIVREFIGHGIGPQFHTSLQIPHYYDPRNDVVLVEGMTFTIEPMLTIGGPAGWMWDDDWTVLTVSGQRTAQYEHTLAVTSSGVEILTLPTSGPTAAERSLP